MHQQNPADAPPESRGTTRIRRTPTESCLHLQRGTASAAIVPMYHMKLDLQAHWNYFCRNVKERPQRPKFLGLQMSQN